MITCSFCLKTIKQLAGALLCEAPRNPGIHICENCVADAVGKISRHYHEIHWVPEESA